MGCQIIFVMVVIFIDICRGQITTVPSSGGQTTTAASTTDVPSTDTPKATPKGKIRVTIDFLFNYVFSCKLKWNICVSLFCGQFLKTGETMCFSLTPLLWDHVHVKSKGLHGPTEHFFQIPKINKSFILINNWIFAAVNIFIDESCRFS